MLDRNILRQESAAVFYESDQIACSQSTVQPVQSSFTAGTYEVSETGINEFTLSFTFSEDALTDIEVIEESFQKEPHLRVAQKALAKEMTTMIHGQESYEQAVKLSEALFSGQIANLTKEEIEVVFEGLPKVKVEIDTPLIDVLLMLGAASSKREARDFISGGGVLVNSKQEKDLSFVIKKENAIDYKYTVIRRGKKNYYLIEHE